MRRPWSRRRASPARLATCRGGGPSRAAGMPSSALLAEVLLLDAEAAVVVRRVEHPADRRVPRAPPRFALPSPRAPPAPRAPRRRASPSPPPPSPPCRAPLLALPRAAHLAHRVAHPAARRSSASAAPASDLARAAGPTAAARFAGRAAGGCPGGFASAGAGAASVVAAPTAAAPPAAARARARAALSPASAARRSWLLGKEAHFPSDDLPGARIAGRGEDNSGGRELTWEITLALRWALSPALRGRHSAAGPSGPPVIDSGPSSTLVVVTARRAPSDCRACTARSPPTQLLHSAARRRSTSA